MSTYLNAPAAAQGIIRQPWATRAIAVLKHWWVVYMNWRLRLLAIDMGDDELEAIGILRP